MSDFASNLRLLTSYHASIAEVCRQLGLNRQQFNKYLSGRSRPSDHSLRRICDFFGVEEHELMLPEQDFRDLVALKPQRRSVPSIDLPPYVALAERLFDSARKDSNRYLGFYFAYRRSFSDPELVLKSLVQVRSHEGRLISKRLERVMEPGQGDLPPYLCKYLGYFLFLSDRIYVIECETLAGDEISETIFYPSHRHKVSWLSGLNLGVSTSDERAIGAAQVLYQHIGRQVSLRRAIARLGKFPPTSDEVPAYAREVLGGELEGADSPQLFAQPR